jgi:hypothetical protein
MKLTQRLPILAGLCFLLSQGCSNSTTPPPTTTTPSTVHYSANATYSYNQYKLDTASTSTAKDQIDSTSLDVITSMVIDTNATYAGKTGVVVIVNSHTNGDAMDTTREYQDSGNLYTYNYGLTGLNSNAAAVAAIGHPLDVGWVLQSKLTATTGTTWEADSTSTPLIISGFSITVNIVDKATEESDTTVTIKGKSMLAKHSLHSVTASGSIFGATQTLAVMPVDTYVTLEEGMVLNVVHSFQITVPTVISAQVRGQYTAMTSF